MRGGAAGSGRRQLGPEPARDAIPEDAFVQPKLLIVEQGARELRVTVDGIPTRYVYGQKVSTSAMAGTSERIAGWRETRFVIEQDMTQGPTITRIYELIEGGQKLLLTTAVTGGRMPDVTYRTVFDRVSP